MLTNRAKFLIEDNPDNENHRILEYHCVLRPTGHLIIRKILDLTNGSQEIDDPRHLPDPQALINAANLYNWHHAHQTLFTNYTITTDLGPDLTPLPDHRPEPSTENPDDHPR